MKYIIRHVREGHQDGFGDTDRRRPGDPLFNGPTFDSEADAEGRAAELRDQFSGEFIVEPTLEVQ